MPECITFVTTKATVHFHCLDKQTWKRDKRNFCNERMLTEQTDEQLKIKHHIYTTQRQQTRSTSPWVFDIKPISRRLPLASFSQRNRKISSKSFAGNANARNTRNTIERFSYRKWFRNTYAYTVVEQLQRSNQVLLTCITSYLNRKTIMQRIQLILHISWCGTSG